MVNAGTVGSPIRGIANSDWAARVPRDAGVKTSVKTVYLAHPYAAKDEIEANFQPILEGIGLNVINPFQRGEQAVYDKVLAPGGGGLTAAHCEDIVRMDLEKIDQSDAVVAAMVTDNMIGTIMEIFYTAHVCGKLVFAYTPRKRETEHPWIRFYSLVFPAQAELIAALKRWKGDDIG